MIEKLIAYYCAPVLAGIKPANLVACYKEKFPNVCKEVERLNRQLNSKDIYLEILCECEKRVLLMVYRKKVLLDYLKRKDINGLLSAFGYEKAKTVHEYIKKLKSRLRDERFPHEIGAFLGYPDHDIYGFIHHKNEGCLLTGEWKVYKNTENARKLF